MLSPEQQIALERFQRGENLFITGEAGTGKTYLIQTIVAWAQNHRRQIQVCAMTGTAARLLNCKATTLHSWSGIRLAKGPSSEILKNVRKNRRAMENWKKFDILIIDEVSMMSNKVIQILDEIGKTARRQPFKPFGGLQIVLTGDFFQLAPIETRDEPETGQFCFEWDQWYNTFPLSNHIVLKQMFRQTDPVFRKILSEVRLGHISDESCQLLYPYLERDMHELQERGIVPTQILPVRSSVDQINAKMYRQIREPEMSFPFKIETNRTSYIDSGEPLPLHIMLKCQALTQEEIEAEIQQLLNVTPCESTLNLKKGTFVMITVNIDVSMGLTNGTQGVVEGFRPVDRTPLIRLTDGRLIHMDRHWWQSEEFPSIAVSNYPLMHCWAISTHRSQGSTLDYAQIDLGKTIFAEGQTYVGLSRVKSLDGLYLSAFDPLRIKSHPLVRAFYQRISESTV